MQRTAQADLDAAVSALVLRARDEIGKGLSAPPPAEAPKH